MEIVPALVCALLGLAVSPLVARLVADPPLREPSDERFVDLEDRPLLVVAALCTALSAGVMGGRLGWIWPLVPVLVMIPGLVVMSLVDLTVYRIPDKVLRPTLLVSVVLIVVVSAAEDAMGAVPWALGAALGAFAFMAIPSLIYPGGLGWGDVKMTALTGLFLGWFGWSSTQAIDAVRLTLVGLVAACVLFVVVGLIIRLARGRRTPFPFGPALAVATLAGIGWAADILG